MSERAMLQLSALRGNINSVLSPGTPRQRVKPSRYFDPLIVEDLFTRFYTTRDELLKLHPDYFEDFPQRLEKSSGTTEFDNRGYFTRKQLYTLLSDIEYCIHILEGLSTISIPSMKITREGVFFAGQYYDAIKSIRDIIKQGNNSLIIIDGYISEEVLDLLTDKNQNVVVQILTKRVNTSLKGYAQRFNQQYGGLSIRTSQSFHDRFVIIDNRDFYHFGASIKDLGNRGFMFSKLEEPSVISELLKQWRIEWAKATIIV